MKVVVWTDVHGWKHRSLLRDGDPDDLAPSGVPQDPPDLDALPWDDIRREMHNRMIDLGLITWQDVQVGQNQITNALLQILRRHVINAYRKNDLALEDTNA